MDIIGQTGLLLSVVGVISAMFTIWPFFGISTPKKLLENPAKSVVIVVCTLLTAIVLSYAIIKSLGLIKINELWVIIVGILVIIIVLYSVLELLRLFQKEVSLSTAPEMKKRLLLLISMVFIMTILTATLFFSQPISVEPVADPSQVKRTDSVASTGQSPLVPPVTFTGLSISNADDVKGETYVINFVPPKKVHLAHLNNPNSSPVQISLIGFPDKFFYTNLMYGSRIDAQSEKDFHLVFTFGIPDKSDFEFEIKDNHDKVIYVRIHLEGDWDSYSSNKINRFKQQISAIPSANLERVYEVANQTIEEEYKTLSSPSKEILTAQLLDRVDQPQAAVIAYAKIVGRINDFDGNVSPLEVGNSTVPAAYTLIRDNKKMEIGFFTELQVGDLIVVNDDQHSLWIGFVDGSKEEITAKNSPYVVPFKGNFRSIWDNLGVLITKLTQRQQEEITAVTICSK